MNVNVVGVFHFIQVLFRWMFRVVFKLIGCYWKRPYTFSDINVLEISSSMDVAKKEKVLLVIIVVFLDSNHLYHLYL